ncbi:conserved membrane hypothetical protein [uncultured delta proteobacterium]|uniref:EamA domain-containing protein n=1 Tax=uncultured delta proteobacterium TaxID=34034 RepID=A0A212K3D1_9DELT|nr:conserved membrane hypothetical protein [uncultured delta proteobacterium]
MAGSGELAAICTAASWGVASQINSAVARRTGATSLALLRLPYMAVLCGILCLIFNAEAAVSLKAALLLSLSGFLGLAMGDVLLYRSILIIGPTMGILMLSLSSSLTAVIGWLFLGEALPLQAVFGICLTLAGVTVVVLEHSESILMPGQAVPQGRQLALGVGLAGAAACGLAVAYVAQRMAMQTGVQPLWAGFIRIAGGGGALWAIGIVTGWSGAAVRTFAAQPTARWMLLVSCSAGSLGVWGASYALAHAPAGVAATLIGLQPIVVACIGAAWYRRKLSSRVVCGSLVAFTGTALVCLR